MKRWVWRIVLTAIVGFMAVYAGDWLVFKLRGSPQSKVTVNHYLIVPLKGNKQEFDYLGSADVPCSRSLFSQGGLSPCWQLRRNPNQNTTV
jgi:hypothetical protein